MAQAYIRFAVVQSPLETKVYCKRQSDGAISRLKSVLSWSNSGAGYLVTDQYYAIPYGDSAWPTGTLKELSVEIQVYAMSDFTNPPIAATTYGRVWYPDGRYRTWTKDMKYRGQWFNPVGCKFRGIPVAMTPQEVFALDWSEGLNPAVQSLLNY